MFLTEYDQDKVLAQAINEDRKRVATDMLMERLPLPLIAKISKLSEDVILKIAHSIGINI